MVLKRDKVVVAMSGGVDSSVAAGLLVEQGFEVMGLFMRVGVEEGEDGNIDRGGSSGGAEANPRGLKSAAQGSAGCGSGGAGCAPAGAGCASGSAVPTRARQGCCSASDAADARFVAGKLGIPFYALNFKDDFDRIIDYFADEYARGRTPNPCVVCNDRLKFGKLVDYADAVGARYIATGHYARVGERDGRKVLMRARDGGKDQSYVLFGLDRAILDRVMFPVGGLEKTEVREIAGRLELPNQDKPDSVEICFAPDRDYARVVRARRPDAFVEGKVVDGAGQVVGEHKGMGHYTIGQRRGLGIAAGKPIYITRLNTEANTITVGDGTELLASSLVADRVSFLVDRADFGELSRAGGSFRAQVKIRYLHRAAAGNVEPQGDGRVRVVFDDPQRAITPGQAVVFYDGDVVVGGGWIERVGD
ncbi:MAG: tRNA 2-thiouridine(34) synthase MnmA [Phycisphaerae bacterium]|jgi:tRNA-specific 2-thiouridylase